MGCLLKYPPVCLDVHDNRTQIDLLTHPDELDFWAEFWLLAYRALMELPRKEQEKFYAAGTRRLLEKNDKYQSYLFSFRVCLFAADGSPMMVIVKMKRLKHEEVPLFRFMSHYPAGYTETHAYSHSLRHLKMTRCEQEALSLYSVTYKEKYVAGLKKLQPNTVNSYLARAMVAMGLNSMEVAGEIWKVINGLYGREDGLPDLPRPLQGGGSGE
jgi:hypothetical protein